MGKGFPSTPPQERQGAPRAGGQPRGRGPPGGLRPAHLQAQGQVLGALAGQLVVVVIVLQDHVGRDDALGVLLRDLHEVVLCYVVLG